MRMLGLLTMTRSGVQCVDFFGAEIMHDYCIRVSSKCTVKRTKHKHQLSRQTVFHMRTRASKLCRIKERHMIVDFFKLQPEYIKRKQTKEFYGFCKKFVWRFLKSIFISVCTLYLEVTGNKLKTGGHACPSKSC